MVLTIMWDGIVNYWNDNYSIFFPPRRRPLSKVFYESHRLSIARRINGLIASPPIPLGGRSGISGLNGEE